jgi:hypothetical protein
MRHSPVLPLPALGALALLAVLAVASSPALARPGGWYGPGWGEMSPMRGTPRRAAADRSREGRVTVDRFVAEGAAAGALGHGGIAVASASAASQPGEDFVGPGNRAAYEAAVVDRLVHAGYDTTRAETGQTAELRVTRSVVQPAEAKRSPVSGEAAMSVGNRGTAYGLAVAVDLTKPLPALVATRLETRIRDRASGAVLWEGRAEVMTREGDERWTDQAIAARLAEALFDGFPLASDASAGPRG